MKIPKVFENITKKLAAMQRDRYTRYTMYGAVIAVALALVTSMLSYLSTVMLIAVTTCILAKLIWEVATYAENHTH